MNDNETAKALRAIAEWHRKQGHLGFMNFCLAGASKIEELNDFQNSQCAIVLAKLSEAERRERAAVEDMTEMAGSNAPCYWCKSKQGWTACKDCRFEWRGPQEAGKGVEA